MGGQRRLGTGGQKPRKGREQHGGTKAGALRSLNRRNSFPLRESMEQRGLSHLLTAQLNVNI